MWTRAALLLALLFASPAMAQMYNISARPRAVTPATANILDETFTNVSGGYSDSHWTSSCASDCGTTDPNETTNCGSGGTTAPWVGDCLEITDSNTNTWITNTFTADQSGDIWVRARVKIVPTWNGAGDRFQLLQLTTVAGAGGEQSDTVRLMAQWAAGPVLQFSGYVASDNTVITPVAFTSGTSYCIEMYANATTKSWQMWVKGAGSPVSLGSGTKSTLYGAGTPTPIRVLDLGTNFYQNGDSISVYYDNVQVSTTGRLTCD